MDVKSVMTISCSITYEYETKTFNYDRGIRLLADVMDVEEAGILDCFVEAGILM